MTKPNNIINKTGRRKTSVARVYMTPGDGKILINNRTLQEYFPSEIFQISVNQPFSKLDCLGKFDIKVNVQGGGLRGQAEATRLGISRALCELDPESKPILKKNGYLTRDPRQVERKKYGQKKARKRFQFSKR
jgi:small subunit ribosomal protein S9